MSRLRASPRTVRFGQYRIDLHRRALLKDGMAVELGGRAFDTLVALIDGSGKVLSTEELMNAVWPGRVVENNSLQAQISMLRKVLGEDRGFIRTVAGRGYQFTAEVDDTGAASAAEPAAPPAPSNLPAHVSELIGRGHVVDEVCTLVTARRLVTLVGTGGIGKTRICLEVARDVSRHFADGVWLAELGSTSDPELIPAMVALALGVLPVSGVVSGEGVASAVRGRSLLLILDNCEHLVDAVAHIAEDLLRGSAQISILATSREPLLAEAEYVYRVPPLEVPDESTGDGVHPLETGAVALFMARVEASAPGFVADDRFAELASTVCRALDGIPLAIELAAVRCNALGIEEVHARLDDRLKLLSGGRRTALPRHQTLLATFDWSFNLLREPERLVFRRLAVFAGSFTLAAAVAVAASDTEGGELDGADVADHLGQLVAKSLVLAVAAAGTVAYRLLETTRAYALQRLLAADEFVRCAASHAAYYLGVLEGAQKEFERLPPSSWQSISGRDVDNVRAALAWASSPAGSADTAQALTVAAVPLWIHLSLVDECRIRVQQALSAGRAVHPGDIRRNPARDMRLLAALGTALFYINMGPDARAAWSRALEIAKELGDDDYQLRALWGLWVDRLDCGECRESLRVAERFLTVAESTAEPNESRLGHRLIGISQHFLGDQTRAAAHLDRMAGTDVAPPDLTHVIRFQLEPWITARAFQARILWLRGFVDEAKRVIVRTTDQAISLGHVLSLVNSLGQGACIVSLLSGDLDDARRYVDLLQEHSTRHGVVLWQAWSRCFSGAVLVRCGDIEGGLRLMRTEFSDRSATRCSSRYMVLLGELASALGKVGELPDALEAIDEALERAELNEERWYLPELLCIKGRLLRLQAGADADEQARICFEQAIGCAQRQDALSLELRATTALARLHASTGRKTQARAALLPVLQRLTEGFGTADHREARTLLDELT